MFRKAIAYRWGYKLARSKYYVVLTDEESVISVHGVDPESMIDMFSLQAQKASLVAFQGQLDKLIKAHNKAIKELRR